MTKTKLFFIGPVVLMFVLLALACTLSCGRVVSGGGGGGGGSAPTFEGIATATANGTNEITVTWLPATDLNTSAESMVYAIYYGTSDYQLFSGTFVTTRGATSYTFRDLSSYTRYCFGVRASNEAGNMDGNFVTRCATTEPERGSAMYMWLYGTPEAYATGGYHFVGLKGGGDCTDGRVPPGSTWQLCFSNSVTFEGLCFRGDGRFAYAVSDPSEFIDMYLSYSSYFALTIGNWIIDSPAAMIIADANSVVAGWKSGKSGISTLMRLKPNTSSGSSVWEITYLTSTESTMAYIVFDAQNATLITAEVRSP
jgi:hypothetical protein